MKIKNIICYLLIVVFISNQNMDYINSIFSYFFLTERDRLERDLTDYCQSASNYLIGNKIEDEEKLLQEAFNFLFKQNNIKKYDNNKIQLMIKELRFIGYCHNDNLKHTIKYNDNTEKKLNCSIYNFFKIVYYDEEDKDEYCLIMFIKSILENDNL